MTNVLVTGASGFIGAALCRALLKRGDRVTALVRDELPPVGCQIVRGNLESIDDCRRAVSTGFDVIYHLGAQALVGVGRRDPLTTFESNVRGTWNLLLSCPPFQRIVVATSDKAYGELRYNGFDDSSYKESDPLEGRGVYDCSKSCADLIAQSLALELSLCVKIVRLGNVYGPGDAELSRIVPSVVDDLVNSRRPIIMSDGTPIRDYLYIDDAVSAYLALGDLNGDRAGRAGASPFNFAGGDPLSVLELVKLATRVATKTEEPDAIWSGYHRLGSHLRFLNGSMGELRPESDLAPDIRGVRSGEIQRQVLDCSKASRLLDWKPRVPLVVGLRKTLEAAWRVKCDLM